MNSNDKKDLLVDGTETLMVLVFCELYNCTVDVVHGLWNPSFKQHRYTKFIEFVDDEGEWGVVEDNMTGDGVLGAIVERRADIGISALYLW